MALAEVLAAVTQHEPSARLTIFSDCQAVVDGWMRGQPAVCAADDPAPHIWRQIWRSPLVGQ
eukprot:8100580-Prorocentrum_lima.AAC.1